LTLFVDSSTFYAAADRSDASNARAKEVLGGGEDLVTSDHVLVETSLLLRHRLGRAAAIRFWDALRAGTARVELIGAADLEAAWHEAAAFPDQDFSLVDLTSFAVMRRLGVLRAATFDDDFAIYRFGSRRERAFEVVR
jgi:predicted nucleic acid-binding protein